MIPANLDTPANVTRYSIDVSDEIVAVGGDWDRFARENDAPLELFSGNILHRSFWDFLSGAALEHVYQRIMTNVRAGECMEFAFRCDSPGLRRFLTLRMTPADDGGINFVTETICTEEREFQRVFDADADRAEGIVIACSWCNKLKTGLHQWQEPEEAVRSLALFETDPMPALSHGMCEQCYALVTGRTKAR
jgi:hypothetical protein